MSAFEADVWCVSEGVAMPSNAQNKTDFLAAARAQTLNLQAVAVSAGVYRRQTLAERRLGVFWVLYDYGNADGWQLHVHYNTRDRIALAKLAKDNAEMHFSTTEENDFRSLVRTAPVA